MKKLQELLFLNNLRGVGKTTIFRKYYDLLLQVDGLDELVEVVSKKSTSLKEPDFEMARTKVIKSMDYLTNHPDITPITVFDDNYPKRLLSMGEKRPFILYAKGNVELLSEPGVAVVGTRHPSEWSSIVEKRLVKRILSLKDPVITSGLALGCDMIAHSTTIDNNGKTIAVLPSGVDVITPASHKGLADKIVESGGCLVSEYEPTAIATRYTFVERDAIVAAISEIVFVIECARKSGTMHTANRAFEYGRHLACYKCDEPGKGDYSGNQYIIREKQATGISDTDELLKLLENIWSS